jgi:hypothetical protein
VGLDVATPEVGLRIVQKQTGLIQHGGLRRYGFHKEPAGGKDSEGRKKARLLEIFGHWTDMVTDLIRATPEEDVLRRDIFDRPPIFKWTQVPRGRRWAGAGVWTSRSLFLWGAL